MPRGPKGEKGDAGLIGNAVKVMRITTGDEAQDFGLNPKDQGKDPAAVALGRKGGEARAKSLSPKRRSQIAKRAAKERWKP
jgi:hypothetical protein